MVCEAGTFGTHHDILVQAADLGFPEIRRQKTELQLEAGPYRRYDFQIGSRCDVDVAARYVLRRNSERTRLVQDFEIQNVRNHDLEVQVPANAGRSGTFGGTCRLRQGQRSKRQHCNQRGGHQLLLQVQGFAEAAVQKVACLDQQFTKLAMGVFLTIQRLVQLLARDLSRSDQNFAKVQRLHRVPSGLIALELEQGIEFACFKELPGDQDLAQGLAALLLLLERAFELIGRNPARREKQLAEPLAYAGREFQRVIESRRVRLNRQYGRQICRIQPAEFDKNLPELLIG